MALPKVAAEKCVVASTGPVMSIERMSVEAVIAAPTAEPRT